MRSFVRSCTAFLIIWHALYPKHKQVAQTAVRAFSSNLKVSSTSSDKSERIKYFKVVSCVCCIAIRLVVSGGDGIATMFELVFDLIGFCASILVVSMGSRTESKAVSFHLSSGSERVRTHGSRRPHQNQKRTGSLPDFSSIVSGRYLRIVRHEH